MESIDKKELKKKKENPLISIVINILIPVLILSKLSKYVEISPMNILILAIIFPLIYSVQEFYKEGKIGLIPALGFINVFLTGVVGLFELSPFWIIVKETAVPLVIGIAVLISLKTKSPLLRKMLYNDQIINIEKVNEGLENNNNVSLFDKRLVQATYLLAFSFFVSALMNYLVATALIHSQPGTEASNQELAKMQGIGWFVIAGPSMLIMIFILWFLISNIKKLSGLALNDILAVDLENEELKMKS